MVIHCDILTQKDTIILLEEEAPQCYSVLHYQSVFSIRSLNVRSDSDAVSHLTILSKVRWLFCRGCDLFTTTIVWSIVVLWDLKRFNFTMTILMLTSMLLNRASIFNIFHIKIEYYCWWKSILLFVLSDYKDLLPTEDLDIAWFM